MNKIVETKAKKPSFIEKYRRQHLIESATHVIAKYGFPKTSLANIAEEAKISKGAISYYFKNKDELVETVMNQLMNEMHEFIKSRVNSKATVLEKLQTYVKASLDFVNENNLKFKVTNELNFNVIAKSPHHFFGQKTYQRCRSFIERILLEGQEKGEFGEFNILAMAAVIQGAIDGIALQCVVDPINVKIDDCKQQLLEILHIYIDRNAFTSTVKGKGRR